MNDFKNFLFLINPVSGSAKKNCLEILKEMKPDGHNFEYLIWEHANQKEDLIKKIEESCAEVLVAIGGDGTINLMAGIALKNDKVLAIVPSGSGNGLARHLGLPLTFKKAISLLLKKSAQRIDIGSVNGHHFLCTSGIGFDALIGQEFSSRTDTGFMGYVKKVLKHAFSYKAESYEMSLEGKNIFQKAMMVTFANASQYGNNAFIAPTANIQDGKLNICWLRPFPLILSPIIAFRLFTKNINGSKYLDSYLGKEFSIKRKPGPIHLDGDPFEMNGTLNVKILEENLRVIF
jgi:YegS/Rv2252/BmrU family lipid kinase